MLGRTYIASKELGLRPVPGSCPVPGYHDLRIDHFSNGLLGLHWPEELFWDYFPATDRLLRFITLA